MKLIQSLLVALLIASISPSLNAQCVSTTFSDTTISCGGPLGIGAVGFIGGTPVLAANFNGGTLGSGWLNSPSVVFTNPCGPSLDGTPSAWFGNTPLPRTLTTNTFDLSCGAQICFDLDFAADDACGGCSDCEDPDLIDEGVFFSYSINGGASWVDIYYFDPIPLYGSGNPVYGWQNYCFNLPPAAWTTSTMLRWDQPNATTQVNDHWGIDNVFVTPGTCGGSFYDWSHIPGAPDAANQTVSPSDTTTYFVSYTDGTTTCTDSVVVNVTPLEIEIVASPDTIDCGSCSDLAVDFLNGSNGSYTDGFDSGINPFIWSDVQGGTPSTICGGGAIGNALYFDGTNPNRYAETFAIDATACGNIDFCLYMGNVSSGGNPCENNENGDDLVLEYSIDGGVTYTTIATYAQSLWDGANYQQCFSEVMPVAAQTTNTMFRWRQVQFFAAMGSDNWSIDDVDISCTSSTITYNWSTGIVNDPSSATPTACPAYDEFYTVSVLNTANGCSASDTSTLFVNVCSCAFLQFDGDYTVQTNGSLDVNGTFEFAFSPGTGTIEVEATNGTGTYTQSFTPPFTDSTVYNYSITGIPNDGTDITMVVYFSDSLSCVQTFDIDIPTSCSFIQFDGAVTPQAGGTMDINGIFHHIHSPSTGTLYVTAANNTGAYSQTFVPPFFDSVDVSYSITGIPNDGSLVDMVVYFSDSSMCSETFDIDPTVGISVVDDEKEVCIFSPNPVYDEAKLVFKNEAQQELTVTVLNENGQRVFETKTNDQSISIKGDELRQGMYFYSVKLDRGDEVCSGKFTVTR